MARIDVVETGPKPHSHAQAPSGEKFSTPANDRDCIKANGGHRPGDRVQCDEEGCKHIFGRVCRHCDHIV